MVSGAVLVGLGVVVVGAAVVVALTVRRPAGLPLGLAVGCVGAYLIVGGAGRLASWLEVGPGAIRWAWSFSRHEIPVTALVDAALVEKGSPASGGAWGGFLGGGLDGVIAWWLLGVAGSVSRRSPTLGSRVLVVIRHHGGRVEIPVIGSRGTDAGQSEAAVALAAVQGAIRAGQVRATGRPRSS
jgi:hypothetical protein